MKGSALASRPQAIICPFCEAGALRPAGGTWAHCDSCASAVDGDVLRTLEQIAYLPDALGAHACECGHPEMRRLPDEVYHCPACGSEVPPVGACSGPEAGSEAYRRGWADGFFGSSESFAHSPELARWQCANDRLDYYRGHRAGRVARWTSDPANESSDRDAREAA